MASRLNKKGKISHCVIVVEALGFFLCEGTRVLGGLGGGTFCRQKSVVEFSKSDLEVFGYSISDTCVVNLIRKLKSTTPKKMRIIKENNFAGSAIVRFKATRD